MNKEQQLYTIWIEAEKRISGAWNPEDANTDVIVTWEDGSRWVATFFSYQNVQTLSEWNQPEDMMPGPKGHNEIARQANKGSLHFFVPFSPLSSCRVERCPNISR